VPHELLERPQIGSLHDVPIQAGALTARTEHGSASPRCPVLGVQARCEPLGIAGPDQSRKPAQIGRLPGFRLVFLAYLASQTTGH
jgi:hypothetical protein